MGDIKRNFQIKPGYEDKHQFVCKECNRETSHKIIVSYDESGYEDCGGGNSVDWYNGNQIIQCLGCETVSFRKVSTFSEDIEYDHDGPYQPETVKYYPARSQGLSSIETYLLPPEVQGVYAETILAIENEQHILAGIGIRAIVETVCKNRNAGGRTLFDQIDALKDQSIVTPEGAEILHKLRVLGNQAAHEVKAHNSKQLALAMKVIKHMLEGTYIIPDQVRSAFPD